jgi:hypothetical protein
VDRVFPLVPVRQWVLSLPFALRYRLAYDTSLVTDVLQIFIRAVFGSIRRRAGIPAANRQARCGAVTFVQRFGDALGLNLHFHSLVLDGIYVADDQGRITFRPVTPPSDAEVERVAGRIRRSVGKLLERRGLAPAHAEPDMLQRNQPLLAELYGASVSGRVATGRRAGRQVTKVGDEIDLEDMAVAPSRRCAAVGGFSLHANILIPSHDRLRLEKLCRYAGRPPVATERLSALSDGRLLYRLKRRWRDGTTHIILAPLEMLEKLSALVPPPRFNLVRFHGVLAPAAGWRAMIVPAPDADSESPHLGCPAKAPVPLSENRHAESEPKMRPRNYSWAQLMRRVWDIDVLECPRCGGRMRVLCAINAPAAIRKILDCLGLPSRPPPIAPAAPDRGTNELCFW